MAMDDSLVLVGRDGAKFTDNEIAQIAALVTTFGGQILPVDNYFIGRLPFPKSQLFHAFAERRGYEAVKPVVREYGPTWMTNEQYLLKRAEIEDAGGKVSARVDGNGYLVNWRVTEYEDNSETPYEYGERYAFEFLRDNISALMLESAEEAITVETEAQKKAALEAAKAQIAATLDGSGIVGG